MNTIELRQALTQFTGTEQWYRHFISPLLYTDGVKFFAENAGAYWFVDIVAIMIAPLQRVHAFMDIKLISADGKARIVASDGNYNEVWSRDIDYTDCPEGEWEFFLTHDVLMIPSEY